MDVKNSIKQALSEALEKCGISVVPHDVPIEYPADIRNGDYASGAALKYSKQVGMSPISLAQKIIEALGTIPGIQKSQMGGPGFINFFIEWNLVQKEIESAAHDKEWGKNNLYADKRIMVEYTDPNPFKEFHIGHLMSNAIGESISRLLKYSGAEVFRANYQGDVGPHVAKAIWAMRKGNVKSAGMYVEAMGAFYAEGAKQYEENPVAKKEIDEINQKIYDKSDSEINLLYGIGRSASLSHFEDIYKILGTEFDHFFFESETAPKGVEIIKAHPDIFVASDGAIVYKGEQDGLHTRVFITSKGLPTYETKDIGLAELKDETWKFDTSITITAQEQAEYFAVVLAAMKKVLPMIAPKIKHVSHGMMRLMTGKMSSRTGDVITGESLINDLKTQAKIRADESRATNKDELAQQVAVAAIKYQILKQASGKDITFDRDRALSLEGDSGPYLQYARARAISLADAAAKAGIDDTVKMDQDFTEFVQALILSRMLIRFRDIVIRSAQELEPHHLTNFLIEIAGLFNSWYASRRIIGEIYPNDFPSYARLLATAVANTLEKGLDALGIPAPEKM